MHLDNAAGDDQLVTRRPFPAHGRCSGNTRVDPQGSKTPHELFCESSHLAGWMAFLRAHVAPSEVTSPSTRPQCRLLRGVSQRSFMISKYVSVNPPVSCLSAAAVCRRPGAWALAPPALRRVCPQHLCPRTPPHSLAPPPPVLFLYLWSTPPQEDPLPCRSHPFLLRCKALTGAPVPLG